MRSILAPAAALLLAAPLSAQGLVLDVSGGILNEPWNFTITGSPPGEFWVLCFADTTGPLPIAAIDPSDTRSWSLDASMFLYTGFYGLAPPATPAVSLLNNFASLVGTGIHLYAQAFTVPGPATLVDLLSDNVVIAATGPHGTSTDTVGVPIRTRGFATGQRLPNGDHIIFGGNDGALQGGTYLKSVERYYRKVQAIKTAPDVPDLSIERSFAASAVLNDGRILVCGGNDDLNNTLTSAEIYNPATNAITPTGSMAQKRYFHTLVKLGDGRVLALGGSTSVDNSSPLNAALAIVNSATASAEIYNPATGTWSNATVMPWKRTGLAAALLPDGKVLVCGGAGPFLAFFKTASRYDAATNGWVSTPDVTGTARALSTTTVLANGRVLVSGGATGSILTLSLDALPDVSIYDGVGNAWQGGVPSLPSARAGHSATLLPTGDVVVCGGAFGNVLSPGVTTSVVRWNGTAWSSIGSMNHERAFHYAAPSQDGQRVFLYGGIETGGVAAITPSAELFAP